MANNVEASVVIGTYNGSNKIPSLFNALLKQTVLRFEVIVVIDGSTDNTEEVSERFRSLFIQFKIVIQSNQGRAGVRNSGVREASSDLIIFYDDDMIPFEDSVQRHIIFHTNYKGILGGSQIETQSFHKTDIQNYKAFLTELWTRKYNNGVTRLDFSNLFFSAANASLKKDVFNFLNGFDKTLNDAEDYDFAYRALEKEVPVFFDKENKAIHYDLITCIGYIKRLRLYSKAHRKLQQKYSYRYSTSINKSFLKRLIYKLFSLRFWPYVIEKQTLRKVLPKKMRFKIYDIVIQSLAIEYPDVEL